MARSNFQSIEGTYTGDGTDNRTIPLSFEPTFVLVKGGANIACFKTRRMPFNSTLLISSSASYTGGIKSLQPNGFVVGTDATVNANGTTYYYIAFRGSLAQQYFRTFEYIGDGSDNRQLNGQGIFFTPDFLLTKGDTTQSLAWKSSSMTQAAGGAAAHFAGLADAADELQQFISNGIELGTSARTNSSGVKYYGMALKNYSGVITNGTYTGNATDDRAITVGFQPDWVFVKNGSTTNPGILRTASFVGDSSISLSNSGSAADQIQSFTSTGFTVGTVAHVNGNGNTIWWVAGKTGSFNLPLTRTAV